jgi:hypothetical protein
LENLSELVNSGYDFEGEYLVLTDNIEMTGNFTPIGSYYYDCPFSGTFDGVGSMNIKDDDAGLFAYLVDAQVKKLIISGASIIGNYSGAVVGYAQDETGII